MKAQSWYGEPLNFQQEPMYNIRSYSLGSSELQNLYEELRNKDITIGDALEQMQTGKYDVLGDKITTDLREHILENIDFGDTFQKDIIGPYNPVVDPTFKNNQLDIDVEKKQLLHPESAKYLDLAQGGIARLGYRGGQLVQPGPGRPGYQGPLYAAPPSGPPRGGGGGGRRDPDPTPTRSRQESQAAEAVV